MNSALVDLVETMTEEEREFTARLLRTLQDERGKGPDRVTPHQVGCLLPDGHEGPCVEAVWKEEAGPARPMKQIWGATAGDWRLDARGDGRWWVRGPYGTMTMSAERAPLSPDAEEARRRAEDCLRKLLTVPGITLTVPKTPLHQEGI